MTNAVLFEDLERINSGIGPKRDKFWESTILLTGCAGFVGFYISQYLVRYAKQLGIRRVIGLDTFLLNKPKWLEHLQREYQNVLEVHESDISARDITFIKDWAEVNYVLHMASIASPAFYRQFPVETVDANVWGLRSLLDTFKDSRSLQGFVFFSSSEVYGDPETGSIPTSEDYHGNVSSIGPRACYDESKRFGETLCYVYSRRYGMPIIVVRPFNNYGPGMRLDDRRLPADLARSVLAGEDLVILSNGLPTRTFCYISDAVTGYLLSLLFGDFDYFNIGIDRPEVQVRELARIYSDAARDLWGYRGSIRYESSTDRDYLTDAPNRRCPSITKANSKLGYNPQILVHEGVSRHLQFLRHEQGLQS